MKHRWAAAVIVLLCVSSACNSTNRFALEESEELTSPEGGTAKIDPKTGKPVSTKGSGPGRATTGGTTTGGQTTGGQTGAPGSGGGANVPGTTSKSPLKIGFIVIKGGDALVTNSLGTPVSFGDGKKQVGALVKDLNARGGIGGRPIEPHIYEWNVADANDSPAVGCVKLTEDEHVFAIITVVNLDEAMIACAYKHKTILVNASFGAGDAYLAKQYGTYFFSPSLLHLDMQKKLLIDAMNARGYLKGAKVGIAVIGGDDQQFQRVTDKVIVPKLKALKVEHQTFVMTTEADVSAAVLRFAADGVDTVIFASNSAIPPLLFMRQADSQGFTPRYLLTDSDDSTTLGQYGPRRQAEKIVGTGSLPISNVAVSEHPQGATEKRCLALMRANGENDTNRRSNLTAEPYCEATWAFEAVADKVQGEITSEAWRGAYATVRTSYQAVTALGTNFNNGRHDNASKYRELYWKTSCSCVSYRGELRPIPSS